MQVEHRRSCGNTDRRAHAEKQRREDEHAPVSSAPALTSAWRSAPAAAAQPERPQVEGARLIDGAGSSAD